MISEEKRAKEEEPSDSHQVFHLEVLLEQEHRVWLWRGKPKHTGVQEARGSWCLLGRVPKRRKLHSERGSEFCIRVLQSWTAHTESKIPKARQRKTIRGVCSIVTIVNNTILRILKCLRVDLKSSHPKKKNFVTLFANTCWLDLLWGNLQYTQVMNHYILHRKLTECYMSIILQ